MLYHLHNLAVFAFRLAVVVNTAEHKLSQFHRSLSARLGETYIVFNSVGNHRAYHSINSLAVGFAQNVCKRFRNILFVKYSRTDRIVNIVVDICDTVGIFYDLTFQRLCFKLARVVDNGVSYLHCKVKIFQLVRNTQRLLVVLKAVGAYFVKRSFARMTERGVAEVVSQSRRFRKVFVKTHTSGNGAGYLSNLKRVGKTGAVMVSFGCQKYLHFVHKPAEGFAVDYSVSVPHKGGTHIVISAGEKSSRGVFGKEGFFAQHLFLKLKNIFLHGLHSFCKMGCVSS